MNQHVEKAKKIRSQMPVTSNCAQTIMRVYAEEMGISEETAAQIASNFGGGMKCGSVCGVVTAGLMVLGAKGIGDLASVHGFQKSIAQNHGGMICCKDLLKANAEKGGNKKAHCDGLILEAIDLIDKLV